MVFLTFKSASMPDTLHLRIKKEYAASLIEDLIKVDAIEIVEGETVELSTCKMHRIEPCAWLKNVLQRIPVQPINKIAELLPHRWQTQIL